MQFFIVLLLLAVTEAGVITSTSSTTNCVTIRDVNYEKEVLQSEVSSPYQLAIDYDTNTLFYSFTSRQGEMFKISYLSLKTGETGIVSGIRGGFANAVNHKGNKIYMGGDDGIYEYDSITKSAKHSNINEDASIWQMFYKDGLYFTTYPHEKAYLYKNDHVGLVPEFKNIKVLIIAVSKDNNLVYSNSSGLFLYSKAKEESIYLADSVVNGISADIDSNLFYSTPSGLYYINEQTKSVEELAKISNVYGIAIESNGNIIYSTEEEIVRLKPTKQDCFVEKNTALNADNE